MTTYTLTRKPNPRPKWARGLYPWEWRHLVEVNGPKPLLRDLRANAETCPDCKVMLKRVR